MKQKKTTALTVAAFCLVLLHMAGNAALAKPLDFSVIAGHWARIDGSYTLRVDNVQSDGTADVSYYNPAKSMWRKTALIPGTGKSGCL